MNIALIALSAFYYSQWTLGPLIMMGPPAIVALLWSCVDIGCFCFRREHAGVDLIACLIVDTLLFLDLSAISGVLIATLTHLAIFALARYERKMHGKVQSPPQVVYPPPVYGVPTSRSHEVHAEHSIQELPATSDGMMGQKKS
ncbi:hypothetical protein E4U09_002132 [Claviceps aff. purpurea]|uniref:Uncharacterized protein n=1 Tax=Claviceps aff. purpurea TaxID=1967640 RepID=A0A9P7QG64_9HYPO|nr:hypothetical protein E4U09_002132 [Claviceps aff. purpurea]